MGVSRALIVGGAWPVLLSAVFLVVIWEAFGNLWWLTFVAFVAMYLAQYRLLPGRWNPVPCGAGLRRLLPGAGRGLSVLPTCVDPGHRRCSGSSASPSGMVLRPSPNRTNYRWFVIAVRFDLGGHRPARAG